MEAVDSYIPEPERDVDKPFLMPIEDIFSISGRGTASTARISSVILARTGIRPVSMDVLSPFSFIADLTTTPVAVGRYSLRNWARRSKSKTAAQLTRFLALTGPPLAALELIAQYPLLDRAALKLLKPGAGSLKAIGRQLAALEAQDLIETAPEFPGRYLPTETGMRLLAAFAGRHLNAAATIVVTASHNPPEYNGFKICSGIDSVYGEQIQQILAYIQANDFESGQGSVETFDVTPYYKAHLLENITVRKRLKVGIDTGNGTDIVIAGRFGDTVNAREGDNIVIGDSSSVNSTRTRKLSMLSLKPKDFTAATRAMMTVVCSTGAVRKSTNWSSSVVDVRLAACESRERSSHWIDFPTP